MWHTLSRCPHTPPPPPAAILAPPFRFLFADLHLVSFLFFTGAHWDTLLIPDWDAEGDCKDFVTSYYPSQRRGNGISRPLARHTHTRTHDKANQTTGA